MTANPETLEKIANTIRSELPKYLSSEFIVHDVTAENRPRPGRRGLRPHQGHPRRRPPKAGHTSSHTVPTRYGRPLRTIRDPP